MSHFNVWVIVPLPADRPNLPANPNVIDEHVCRLLAPFDVANTVPQYDSEDVDDECLDGFLAFYQERAEDPAEDEHRRALIVKALAEPERAARLRALYLAVGYDWNSGDWAERGDGKWVETSTSNPSGRWDWWQIAGPTFGESLLTREGVWASIARVRDIDYNAMTAMRRVASIEAMDAFDAGTTTDYYGSEGGARQALGFPVGMGRDEWIADRSDASPLAVVDARGRWHEQATPGDFGMTGPRNTSWAEEFAAVLGTADPDAVVVVVDCHI